MVALLCPGQGSQELGMGKELAENFPAARAVFDEVNDALNQDLWSIIQGDDAEALTATANAQPAIMAVSVAAHRALESVAGPMAEWKNTSRVAAGHSLGEYSAHVIAGTFDLCVAAKLLRIRGDAMQKAVSPGEGAMAAILNVDIDTLTQICEENIVGNGCCQVANDNAPGQVVISGDKASVEKAIEAAKAVGAKRCVLLPVSAPFHCALMQSAQETMQKALIDAGARPPVLPVLCNVDVSEVTQPEQIIDSLTRQVTGRVRWVEIMQKVRLYDNDPALELGHGKVLAGLAKRIDKSITVIGVGLANNIDAAAEIVHSK